MCVSLDNHFAHLHAPLSKSAYEILDAAWSFFAPGARWDRRYQLYLQQRALSEERGDPPGTPIAGWDGRIKLLKGGRLPSGIFRATRRELEAQGIQFKIQRNLPEVAVQPNSHKEIDPKYAYQHECAEKMLSVLHKGGGTILSATASGKTRTAALFMARLNCPCLFAVDKTDLMYQSQAELAKWLGEEVGIVGDQQYQLHRVTVGMVQTFKRHMDDKKFMAWYRRVQVVIVDELHVQMSKKNFAVLQQIQPMARYGLTATLQMKKKPVRMNVWAFSGPVIFRFPILEGQKRGVLSEGRAIQLLFPPVHEDIELKYQDAVDVEIVENEVKLAACSKITRWLLALGKYVIVLVSRVAHVAAVEALFRDVPYRVAYGAVGTAKRRKAIEKFERGDIRLIIANIVFEKGVNIKRVDAIIDLAEQRNKNSTLQKFGRGVRLHEDKEELLYIDIGSSGSGRFGRAARSRARALKAEGIPITKAEVVTPSQALKAVVKVLPPKQEKLF